MPLSCAIIGFRHAHIYDLVERIKVHPDLQLVAVCEEDDQTREQVAARDICPVVFASYSEMLDRVECDIIGVGDFFSKRGAIICEALRRGKHVLSDKPICTSLDELATIRQLAAGSKLCVGCQLDIRDNGNFRALRQIMVDGAIGEVHAIGFGGQHPLLLGTRPGWYFQEGSHGGTLNDIAIHAFDLIPWLTGLEFSSVNYARTWNAGLPSAPQFHNAAQVMLTLNNGCGVLGDVSYLSPDSHGFQLPNYWRTTLWGTNGVAETSYAAAGVMLYQNGEKEGRVVPPAQAAPGGYLRHFLAEIAGEKLPDHLTTSKVLDASRVALCAQRAADNALHDLPIEAVS